MNASNARKSFARVLASVVNDGEPVLIVRYSRPIAALVPIDRLHRAERGKIKGNRAAANGAQRQRG